MEQLTILIVVQNEKVEMVNCCVDSIRTFIDIDNAEVVVINNGMNAGLSGWATMQGDIVYVDMEGTFPYGAVLNQILEGLEIKGDILLLDPSYMITPGSLSALSSKLDESDGIGAIGGISNQFCYNQTRFSQVFQCANYEQLIETVMQLPQVKLKTVIGLCAEAIAIKKETLDAVGAFDEEFVHANAVIKDYCLRLLEKNLKCYVCENLAYYSQLPEQENMLTNSDALLLEKKWGMHYFNDKYNGNLIYLMQNDEDAKIDVLEIGCDCAATLVEIQNRYPNAHIYGCELNEAAVRVAGFFAEAYVNNIEEQNLPFADTLFDYIIFGDVLEHLRNPLAAVEYCKNYLKPNGCIIASIPNLMHISVVDDLLDGNFTYRETGLLDKTHIHMFTYNEIVRMFQQARYQIEDIETVELPISNAQRDLIQKLLLIKPQTERFMYETFQYLVRARKI